DAGPRSCLYRRGDTARRGCGDTPGRVFPDQPHHQREELGRQGRTAMLVLGGPAAPPANSQLNAHDGLSGTHTASTSATRPATAALSISSSASATSIGAAAARRSCPSTSNR